MRFNKNAHCFAVEPSGWRFTFDASIFVTLFRRFAPSDSPRVHQWRCQTTTPQLYLPFGKLDCFAVIFCFAKLNFHVVKVKANIISLFANGKKYHFGASQNITAKGDFILQDNLSATCRRHTSRRRHIAFAKGKNIVSSLLYGSLPGDCHVALLLAMTKYFVRKRIRVCLLDKNKIIYILSL